MPEEQVVSRRPGCLIWVFFLCALASGCSQHAIQHQAPGADVRSSVPSSNRSNLSESALIDMLYDQYHKWKGTRYAYGGMSRRGVDCSGLVYITFQNRLNKSLPRTTAEQSSMGYSVSRSDLKEGDLVFFKTGKKLRHVGIYIEDGQFLHVSSKKGVMLSRLNDYYWKDRYWFARRVL